MPLQEKRERGRQAPQTPGPAPDVAAQLFGFPQVTLRLGSLRQPKKDTGNMQLQQQRQQTKATFAYYDVCIMKQFISHFLFLGQNAAYEEVFVCLSGSFLAFLIDFKAAIRPTGPAKYIAKYLRVSQLN